MKGFIRRTPRLLRLLTGNFASGMALFPFILVKDKASEANKVLIHHERIHLRQQLEMGVLLFYIWYGIEYLIRRVQFKTHYWAYRNISFEREAFRNQAKADYLRHRRCWAFLGYLKKPST